MFLKYFFLKYVFKLNIISKIIHEKLKITLTIESSNTIEFNIFK